MNKMWHKGIAPIFVGAFFCILFTSPVYAEVDIQTLNSKVGEGLTYTLQKNVGNVSFIENKDATLPLDLPIGAAIDSKQVANEFMKEYGQYFGINDSARDVRFVSKKTDELGMTHVLYNQQYADIPVFGGQVIVHVRKDMSVASANGRVIPVNNLDIRVSLSQEEAITKAKELWQQQFHNEADTVIKSDVYIFNKGLVQNTPDDESYLVYKIDLYKEKPMLHEYYFIDAHTGQLVYQITGMQTAVHRHIYDCSYIDGDCYMDAYDGLSGYTFGRSEGQPARGTSPYYLSSDTDTLYTLLGNLYDYYSSTFSRSGANGLGGIGDGSITYPSEASTGVTNIDYSYAEYSYCPNAFFNSANSIHFCQGYVSTDITGHEYAHAVNYFSILSASNEPAGLTYSGESGALNEGNSDIFGEALEYYKNGSNDWLIGEDLGDASLTRSMSDPTDYTYDLGDGATPYPDKFYATGFYCGEGDNSGVHVNSTVSSHAAYLVSQGGTFNGCTISGIGREKEEKIFYRAETAYYTTGTDFNAAYDNILSACYDLYSTTDCIEVEKALMAVEMDQAGKCSLISETTPDCSKFTSIPTITNVSSNTADGRYKAGTVIDVDVTFSKAVTSVGSVIVTLETGSTDRTCSFSVVGSVSGTCNYTVQEGDTSSDLNVKSISGLIIDAYGNTLTNSTPSTNLSSNKSIVIDTTKPVITVSPAAGTITKGTKVKLTASETATIYYTTNGVDPTTGSAHHASPLTLTLKQDTTLKYFAKDSAGNRGLTKTSKYKIRRWDSIITGPGPGMNTLIKAFYFNGTLQSKPKDLYAFSEGYQNGTHVAAGDVDGDHVDEIVVGVGSGSEPWVKVFEKNGSLLKEFLAYDRGVQGGVYVACGDLDDNGRDEIITGTAAGYGPQVRVFNGKTGKTTLTNGFFAYDAGLHSGIRVASGDIDGNGTDEIITGTGPGAAPQVRTFTGKGKALSTDFFVYGKDDRTGINVGAGDVDKNGKDEILTGSGGGRPPEVRVYNKNEKKLYQFTPYASSYTLGVKVAGGDVNGDATDEIITGTENGAGPQVRIFKKDGKFLKDFYAYSSSFRGGVDIATAGLGYY